MNDHKWAMFWAVDADGGSCFFELKPDILKACTGWSNVNKGRCATYTIWERIDIPIGTDWRESLQRRPDTEVTGG